MQISPQNIPSQRAFALPTVMIASVVMLMVLMSGLVASSSVNVSLRQQYNDAVLKDTIEAGATMADACLGQNNYIPQWSGVNTLRPESGCDGITRSGLSCPAISVGSQVTYTPGTPCGVIETPTMRTTFSVSSFDESAATRKATITATMYMFRASERRVAEVRQLKITRGLVFKNNPFASRPVKRFWLFGDAAGIDFGTSGANASLVNFCSAPTPYCRAPEGATVISTKTGTLQFWTDGRTIWNRNGVQMNNGAGLNANQSTTQAAAVFPLAGGETRYVVITNTTENGSTNTGRLWYSIVDMSGDSGLGTVISKNNVLSTSNNSSEALTAAPKSDGSGYWVLTYTPYTLNMVVYSFDNNGVPAGAPTPVTQPVNNIGTLSNYGGYGGFGTLNFSADYTKLVMMAGDTCLGASCPTREGVVRLMGFNAATGQVTYLNAWQGYPEGAGYSADFSPSGNYIYTSAIYPGRLARYDVGSNTSDAAIKQSQTYIGVTHATNSSCTGGGQILRAPNNKMYVANCGTNRLSVLSTPDSASPGFVLDEFNLGTAQSTYGLPQMVTIFTATSLNF